MKSISLLFGLFLFMEGVFGETVSVMEGDSVTLHTNLTEIKNNDEIDWRFTGDQFKEDLLVRIETNKVTIYNEDFGGKFKGRVKADNQTGDIKLENIRTTDSGLYKVSSTHFPDKSFSVIVSSEEMQSISALAGDSVTLQTDADDIQRYDVIRWRFEHENTPIAEMKRDVQHISTSDGPDGRFRDRLKLDYLTGSLTINNIGISHSGLYEVDIISTDKHTIHKAFSVSVSGETRTRTVSVMKGESVTLNTGTELQIYDFTLWMFQDIVLAEIRKETQRIFINDADERFRDRLKLNDQTGSLTITDTRTTDSGLYELKISGRRHSIHKRFTVAVSGLSKGEVAGIVVGLLVAVFAVAAGVAFYYRRKIFKLKRKLEAILKTPGETVVLNTGVKIKTDDWIQWFVKSGNNDPIIAEMKKGSVKYHDDRILGGRFKGRLEINDQTGDLTIINTTTTDTGIYCGRIKASNKVSLKTFDVLILDDTAFRIDPEELHLMPADDSSS